MSFNYYQIEGGDEDWKVVPTGDVDKLPTHMYRTVLSVDVPPNKNTTKEEYAAIKFSGPLYFDLDDAASPASTAKHLVALIEKLKTLDVTEKTLAIYASGGKGFHMLIDQRVFIEKPAKGYTFLPAIYKELAFELSVPSMDFRVYSARKGRMFRVENVLRPNNLYKVQVTVDEVRKIASMPTEEAEAYYKTLCATPRTSFEVASEPRAFGLQAAFESARKKVDTAGKKAAKAKPVDLPDELPSFEAMLRGEGLRLDAGFHPIALQVAITAHARGMTCEELVEAAEGLIQNHVSDGHRYNSADKRKRELQRMWEYTEDNPCYGYGAGAIRALLCHPALDLAGVQVSEEEVQESIANAADNDDAGEYDHAGVIMSDTSVSIPVEGGVKKALALGFKDTTEMLSSQSGKSTVLQTRIIGATGRDLGQHTLELDMFNSASALNKGMMPFGQVFAGNDAQARGVYLRLIERARRGGRRVYVINREGVDVIKMPFHEQPEVREGVLVFSDRQDVLKSTAAEEFADFNLRFVGFPNPLGFYQSDLTNAPRIAELKDRPQDVDSLRQTIFHMLHAQTPAYMSKLIGWMVACHYRMIFHAVYSQFPLLHVNGAAGAGKTSMVKLVANLHYYLAEPKMLTPSSTSFAIKESAAASASIPLIIDEYKPHEMKPGRHDEFKLMFRDAYNCREVSRGGGTREASDFRVVQTAQLSAPICFVAEAAESEAAVMERVVLLTLVKPPASRQTEFFRHYSAAVQGRNNLGILGAYFAKSIVNTYSPERLRKEFEPIYEAARNELMVIDPEKDVSFEERRRKSSTKERTVFNYSVLRFGLSKFNELVRNLFNSDENTERKSSVLKMLESIYESATSTVTELQSQTMPEWLKVFNTFSLMAQADPYSNFHLKRGRHWTISTGTNGEPVLELSPRECYMRYRVFCASTQEKPLFPSEQAFIHAVSHIPCKLDTDTFTLQSIGGPLAFDLQDLRLNGFLDMPEK